MNTRNSQLEFYENTFSQSSVPQPQPQPVIMLNKKPSNRKVRKWKKMKVLVGNYLVPRWVPSDKAIEMEEKLKMKMETQKEMKNSQPTMMTSTTMSGGVTLQLPYSSGPQGGGVVQPSTTTMGQLNLQQLQVQQKMQQLQYQMQQQQQQQFYK
jgi:hypothetical protein